MYTKDLKNIYLVQMVPETLRILKKSSTSFCFYACAWKMFLTIQFFKLTEVILTEYQTLRYTKVYGLYWLHVSYKTVLLKFKCQKLLASNNIFIPFSPFPTALVRAHTHTHIINIFESVSHHISLCTSILFLF